MDDLRSRLNPLPPEERERRALRGFGTGLGLILFFFAWRGHHPRALLSLGAASLCFAAAAPLIFRPLFAVWMPVARVLGVINLWVICGILYYAVFTPYAWILKLAGWKALPLGADPAAETYWEEKPARDPAESARRLF